LEEKLKRQQHNVQKLEQLLWDHEEENHSLLEESNLLQTNLTKVEKEAASALKKDVEYLEKMQKISEKKASSSSFSSAFTFSFSSPTPSSSSTTTATSAKEKEKERQKQEMLQNLLLGKDEEIEKIKRSKDQLSRSSAVSSRRSPPTKLSTRFEDAQVNAQALARKGSKTYKHETYYYTQHRKGETRSRKVRVRAEIIILIIIASREPGCYCCCYCCYCCCCYYYCSR